MDIFIFYMPEQMRLPNTAKELKNLIAEKKGYSSHELNDIILLLMKKEFEDIKLIESMGGNAKCVVSLNRAQLRFFNDLKRVYGISFSQLYIKAIITIAKQEKII